MLNTFRNYTCGPQCQTTVNELNNQALQNELAAKNLKTISKDGCYVAALVILQHDTAPQVKKTAESNHFSLDSDLKEKLSLQL
jgi:hypothetical protein